MGMRGVALVSIALLAIELAALGRYALKSSLLDDPRAPRAQAYAQEAFPAPKFELGAAAWAVDPTEAGANLPPAGRSLFDFLTIDAGGVQRVAFPFTALLQSIARRAQCRAALERDWRECYRAVLIPLGRSLQRGAAGGEFFRYPRVVYAIDADQADAPGAPLAKDRLYLGYHEKAELLEVISYNEAAGRFEFQLVKDYRAGAGASVVYANRAVCAACHQNQAPIFSRQVWDETNANREIAARLAAHGADAYGVKVERGVDIPQAIDNATDRANLLAAYQLLWRRGCGGNDQAGIRCRAAALTAALQYRLSGEVGFESGAAWLRQHFEPLTQAQWRALWPNGLLVPNADIPNRDPLQAGAGPYLQHVAAAFDPLLPRAHSERWQWDTDRFRLVKGVGEFLSEADVRALDRQLSERNRSARARTYRAPCTLARKALDRGRERLSFACDDTHGFAAQVRVERAAGGASGVIERVAFAQGDALSRLDLVSGGVASESRFAFRAMRGALHARRADASALAEVRLRSDAHAAQGELEIEVRDDFEPLRAAVVALAEQTQAGQNDALLDAPFRRARLLPALWAALGLPAREWCCVNGEFAPPRSDDVLAQAAERDAARSAAPEVSRFYQFCARCHESNERVPPGFLRGSAAQVANNLRRCAERIYYRLAMWSAPERAREKSPMPPQLALYGLGVALPTWPQSAELAVLKRYAANLLQAGRDDRAEALLLRPYESLAQCLPAPG